MIKTVIFDLGGVYFNEGVKAALPRFASKYNLTEQEVEAALRGNDNGKNYRKGLISASEFWTAVKTQWKINAPNDELSELWYSSYTPKPETINLVKRLKAAGYELIFLSNNIQERVDFWNKIYPFQQDFKDGVFSHIVHSVKPEVKIYQEALKKATHEAEECVFIDDKEKYLPVAESLGVKTILFKNAKQLESDLKGMGLTFD